MEALRPCTTLNGKWDGYCHLCWNPVYVLWGDTVPPEYDRCAMGDYTANTCPDAAARARMRATTLKLRKEGVLKPPTKKASD